MSSGGVELDRTVDSIRVGARLRGDLGDLDELCGSIEKLGLLQPITITPDGTLVCGARRLAAVRRLGWKTVKVWVTGTISGRLAEVLAEQHENTIRKPLAASEAAALYEELKALYAEDAARRQQASRFTGERNPRQRDRSDGHADSAAPSARGDRATGEARHQAARAITAGGSHFSLEHVLEVQRLAGDSSASDGLRELAARELAAIDADGKVNGHYVAVKAAASAERLARIAKDPTQPAAIKQRAISELDGLNPDHAPPELLRAAQAAIARATGNGAARGQGKANGDRVGAGRGRAAIKRYGVRAFLASLDEMDGWWAHYEPQEIAAALSEEQWGRCRAYLDGSSAFIQAVAAAREKSRKE
ncbi:MAG: ParB N-terminal domain-containing protein [Solirubrobacteraceae bacterium]